MGRLASLCSGWAGHLLYGYDWLYPAALPFSYSKGCVWRRQKEGAGQRKMLLLPGALHGHSKLRRKREYCGSFYCGSLRRARSAVLDVDGRFLWNGHKVRRDYIGGTVPRKRWKGEYCRRSYVLYCQWPELEGRGSPGGSSAFYPELRSHPDSIQHDFPGGPGGLSYPAASSALSRLPRMWHPLWRGSISWVDCWFCWSMRGRFRPCSPRSSKGRLR